MERLPISHIEIRGLSHQLADGRQLFQGSDVVFPTGRVIWLRGESGTGKSLLIRILMGIVTPTQGQVLVNNQDVVQMSFEEFLPYRLNMGLSFDFGGLIHNRDIFGNLMLPLEYHKFAEREQIKEQVSKYLKIFNLDKVAAERPSSVMGGVRKATCVARAFVHEPQVLFLDDPTTGLRGEVKNNLKDLVLKSMSEGRTIFIATEDEAFMSGLDPVLFVFGLDKIKPVSLGKSA